MYELSAKKVAIVERWPLVEVPLYLFLLSYFLLYIFFSFVTVQRACVRTNMRESVVFTWPFPHSGVLTRLKIVCLENEKREAKKKYLDSQKMYVKDMLGRPMEKLSVSWLSLWGTPKNSWWG